VADRIAEITARVGAASKGPWASPKPGIVEDADGNLLAVFGGCAQDEANAALVIHAADDIRYLLNELARMQEASA
jgi:hypothetical protein